jgi:signal transduction histidine kinase
MRNALVMAVSVLCRVGEVATRQDGIRIPPEGETPGSVITLVGAAATQVRGYRPLVGQWRIRLFGRAVSPHVVDGAIAAATTAIAMFEIAVTSDRYSVRAHWPAAIAAALILGGVLWWRRRQPLLVAVVALATMIGSFTLGVVPQAWLVPYLMLLAYSGGAHARGWQSVATLTATMVAGLTIAAFSADGASVTVLDYVLVAVLLGGPWLAGQAMQRREQQATRDRQAALIQERARIARELHDVIAHSLSVVAIQSDAAEQALHRDPALAQEPLRAIRRPAREALAEMRRLVAILRVDEQTGPREPQPGLPQLQDLVQSVRDTGMPVTLHQDGDPSGVPPGVDLAAYRIVHEALTNVRRHAGPAAVAWVAVRVEPGSVEIEVADNGIGAYTGLDSRGHGLLGLRERVALYGGEFHAGPGDGGGFTVRARLPLPVERSGS